MRTLRAWQPSLRARLGKNTLGGERFSRNWASVHLGLGQRSLPWHNLPLLYKPYFDAAKRAIGIAAKLRGLRKFSPKIWLGADLAEAGQATFAGIPSLERG